MKTLTIKDFFKTFPDDDACLAHLMAVRYGSAFACPKCGKHGKFARLTKIPAYSCPSCGHHVHPMKGTPFERTHTPLQKWFYAMYLFTTTRNGVAAKELQRALGVTYKTAWRMGHEIRKYMAKVDGDAALGGHVEIDETFVGGKQKGFGRGHGAYRGKTLVMGVVERGGDVLTRIVPDTKKRTLEPIIHQFVESGTIVNTDENPSYGDLGRSGYRHVALNRKAEEYVRGIHHTNTAEGFWSIVKRTIRGTHIHVSRKHLPKYLGEIEFRFNLRKAPAWLLFSRLLQAF
jgi:transposase